MKNIEEINKQLIAFWDSTLTLTEEQKDQLKNIEESDLKQLAPAEKLYNAVSSLGSCKRVLDYGCGDGWASIIVYKSGCKYVEAVDIGENIIKTAKLYANCFNANINIHSINTNWLSTVLNNTFDGIVCSNVLDVLPFETTQSIIFELARVSKHGAKVIIGLNFYMSQESASQRGMSLEQDKYLFVNGTLRLLSLSDEEWKKLFEPYFSVDKLDYFAWSGESKETRRLFILKRK